MIRVNVTGIKDLEKRLKAAPDKVKREVNAEVQDAARQYSLLAKQSASSQFGDYGNLAGGIQPEDRGFMNAFVFSNARYSAYVEWGTITRVMVPTDLAAYAIQFKGKGIKKNGGLYPRPFFFKHAPLVQKNLVENVTKVLDGI